MLTPITTSATTSVNGYVTGFNDANDSIEITFNVKTSGEYHINVQYASEYGDKLLKQNYNFTDAYLETVYLNAGKNKIKLQNSWGYYDIDKFVITKK